MQRSPRRTGPWQQLLLLGIFAAAAGCATPRSAVESPRAADAGTTTSAVDSAMPEAAQPDSPAPPAPEGCPPNQHVCGSACVDDNSAASCGVACQPCPVIKGGEATCDGRRCGASCPSGKKPCGEACIDLAAPCAELCPQGQHICSGVCVANTDVGTCGQACTPCPSSANGLTTCNGASCALTCATGFHKCGELCVSNTSVASCGDRCGKCDVPQGGSATCDGKTCGRSCPAGALECVFGTCIDVMSNAQHCGRCENDACPAGCAAGVCRCTNPSPANLIADAGFTTSASRTSGWTLDSGAVLTWTKDDVASCAGSGAMVVRNPDPRDNVVFSTSQCVAVKPGTTYNFGGWLKERPGTDRIGNIAISWWGSADCSFTEASIAFGQTSRAPNNGDWVHMTGTDAAPSQAVAARLFLSVIGPHERTFDMVYMTPEPGGF